MLMMLAGPLFLLAAITLPGPFSRLAGIMVLAILVGVTWRVAVVGSFDLLLLIGGASVARRLGFPKPIAVVRARRVAVACIAFVGLEFGTCALLTAGLTGNAVDALPFDLGLLLSGAALAAFVSRRQEQVLTLKPAGSFVSASPQA